MGEVINFDKKNEIEFTSVIEGDGYLELCAFNALKELGYEISADGVKAFQEEIGFENNGVIDVDTFNCLVMAAFEPSISTEIYKKIDEKMKVDLKKSIKKENRINILTGFIIFLMIFFEVVGIVFCCNFVLNIIKNGLVG